MREECNRLRYSTKEAAIIATGFSTVSATFMIVVARTLGLLLAEYTPVFDIIGYIFVPFAMLLGFGPEAVMMGKSCAISLAEMFLPANIVANGSPLSQYVTAIVCVSEILFFSASIPCVLGTDIDISLKDILIVWVERIILSLILAALVVRFLFPLMGVPL